MLNRRTFMQLAAASTVTATGLGRAVEWNENLSLPEPAQDFDVSGEGWITGFTFNSRADKVGLLTLRRGDNVLIQSVCAPHMGFEHALPPEAYIVIVDEPIHFEADVPGEWLVVTRDSMGFHGIPIKSSPTTSPITITSLVI